jgi:hypothetical protein
MGILRQVDVELSRGKNVGQICRDLGIAEQTYIEVMFIYMPG